MLVPVQNIVKIKLASLEKTVGGIIIPVDTKRKSISGQVVSIGPGRISKKSGNRVPVEDVSIGDYVLVGHGMGQHVKENGEDFLLIREPDIMLVSDEPYLDSYDPGEFSDLVEGVTV